MLCVPIELSYRFSNTFSIEDLNPRVIIGKSTPLDDYLFNNLMLCSDEVSECDNSNILFNFTI